MIAVLGWTGAVDSQRSAQQILEDMTGASLGHSQMNISASGNVCLAANKFSEKQVCSKSSDWHVVFIGTALSSDSQLNQQIQEQGVAKALVERYRTSGSSFLATLTGRFVLAMARDDGRKSLLAVDRFGIDPMCYATTPQGIAFASLPVWVSRHPHVEGSVAQQSIYNYLYFHMIPSPDSLFNKVSKLGPGCCVIQEDTSIIAETYWKPKFHNERGAIPAQYAQQFRQEIRNGVAASVGDSDSAGCFLSGGTDSSTIAGMLGEVTDGPAKTFSIGFASQGYDETEYSRLAASHFGTEHHEYYVTPDDVVSSVPSIAAAYGEPFGNSSVVPTYFCAKLAREHGVTRLLGGDGGDELFGGNERYARQLLFSVYDQVPDSVKKGLLEPMLLNSVSKSIPLIRKLSSYIEQARLVMPDRMATSNLLNSLGVEEIMEPEFLASIDQNQPLALIREAYSGILAKSLLNQILAMDFKITLADNDLPKVKFMCDLANVDVQFPFLYAPLVELSLGLPVHGKVKNLSLRPFFKQSLKGFLPDAILTKTKHGFGLPFGPWLLEHQALRELAFDALSDFKARRILSPHFIDDLCNRRLAEHASYYGTLIWVVMMLEHWMSAHKIKY